MEKLFEELLITKESHFLSVQSAQFLIMSYKCKTIREKLHSELYPRKTKLCYQPPQDSDSLKILSAAIILRILIFH